MSPLFFFVGIIYPNMHSFDLFSELDPFHEDHDDFSDDPIETTIIADTTIPTMKGSGVSHPLLTAAKTLSGFSSVLSAVDGAVFGPVGTYVSNTMGERYNKNPLWQPGFAGERHMVLPTAHGLTRANFAGPGTALGERLLRGDKGVDGPNGIDAAAKKHDIAYANATGEDDVMRADDAFIENVQGSDASPFIKSFVTNSIKAKQIGEKIGILPKGAFTGTKKNKTPRFDFVKDTRKKITPGEAVRKRAMK